MLHVNDEFDGIQIDTLTSTLVERSLQRLCDLLAEILAHIALQLHRDAFLPAWPTLASARTAELALVDHLEGTDLRVGVVLLVSGQLWPCAERV